MHERQEHPEAASRSGPADVSDRYVAFEHDSELVIVDSAEKTRWIKSDLALPREETV